jgi:hypothetical protein
MFNFNPDLMIPDGEDTGARPMRGPSNPPVSAEELAKIMAEEDAKYDPRTGMPLDLLESGIPEVIQSFAMPGFTPGPFPKAFEKFFGAADPNMIAYKIVTNADGSQQLEVQTGPGSTQTFGAPIKVGADGTVVPFQKDPTNKITEPVIKSTLKTAEQIAAETKAAENKAARQSAYDLLYTEFERYGLASLVTPLKDLITSGISPSEFTLRLRETDAYKNRFAANQARIKNGLRALSEADYIRNEDAYQEVMRRRGLPTSYYEQTVDPVTGITKQKGFEALLAGDVSSTELEDRIVTAQDRVLNANPEIARTLKQFYPGISNGDILAYSLDPVNAINAIKRKITTAEIGTAAKQEGLTTGLTRAEELATMGVTGATAAQGYKTIGGGLQRGSQLASIYGEDAYNQATAEQEVFGLAGAPEARKQRQKITGLEKATFSGQTGLTSGALARDRAGAY